MLSREKRNLLKHIDKLAKENAKLLRRVGQAEDNTNKMKGKNAELMEKCRKVADENTALHLENARLKAKASKKYRRPAGRK